MDSAIVSVGNKLRVCYPEGTEVERKAEVLKVSESTKIKHGSSFKYVLQFHDNGECIETRLRHLQFKIKKEKKENLTELSQSSLVKRSRNSDTGDVDLDTNDNDDNNIKSSKKKKKKDKNSKSSDESIPRSIPISHVMKRNNKIDWNIPTHKFICAPMVGGSELAFRLLCRRYGCDLAYTPMISSDRFINDKEYQDLEFQTTPEDRPLVCHFSGNDPDIMLKAAKLVENKCDAIDLNLGCPQRVAFIGHYGSFLLDEEDRPLVLSIVKKLSDNIKIPIFVKIRLLSTLDETITLCKQLVNAGAALIAIHARYRVNLVNRTGPGARDGAAFLEQITEIRKVIPSNIMIISNGNIREHDDIEKNMLLTNADGVMSAEGLLDNPAIFASNSNIHNNINIKKIDLAIEYLDLAIKYPVKIKSIIFHIRRIIKNELNKYQLLNDLCNSKDLNNIHNICLQCQLYENGDKIYIYDNNKEIKEKKELEKRKHEEGKRKRYEERMTRKAKRENKSDLTYYLSQGLENPTSELINKLKILLSNNKKDEVFDIWKSKHGQHCYEYHFNPNRIEKCKRERTCAFLHCDPSYDNFGDAEKFG